MTAERDRRALDDTIADDDDVAIAAITAAELLVGVELADGRNRKRREAFVEDALETLTSEDYTVATARAHARLLSEVCRSGRPRGAHDLIIAATSLSSGRTLVTADARGFEDLPGIEVRILKR